MSWVLRQNKRGDEQGFTSVLRESSDFRWRISLLLHHVMDFLTVVLFTTNINLEKKNIPKIPNLATLFYLITLIFSDILHQTNKMIRAFFSLILYWGQIGSTGSLRVANLYYLAKIIILNTNYLLTTDEIIKTSMFFMIYLPYLEFVTTAVTAIRNK